MPGRASIDGRASIGVDEIDLPYNIAGRRSGLRARAKAVYIAKGRLNDLPKDIGINASGEEVFLDPNDLSDGESSLMGIAQSELDSDEEEDAEANLISDNGGENTNSKSQSISKSWYDEVDVWEW